MSVGHCLSRFETGLFEGLASVKMCRTAMGEHYEEVIDASSVVISWIGDADV